jgi:hypothetical protein
MYRYEFVRLNWLTNSDFSVCIYRTYLHILKENICPAQFDYFQGVLEPSCYKNSGERFAHLTFSILKDKGAVFFN